MQWSPLTVPPATPQLTESFQAETVSVNSIIMTTLPSFVSPVTTPAPPVQLETNVLHATPLTNAPLILSLVYASATTVSGTMGLSKFANHVNLPASHVSEQLLAPPAMRHVTDY